MKSHHPSKHLSKYFLPLLLAGILLGGSIFAGIMPQPAMANPNGYGFGPQVYKKGYAYGNGVYFAPRVFTLYSQPDLSAEAIGEFSWSRTGAGNAVDITTPNGEKFSVHADHVFFCFYPQLDVAMMAVTGDNENGEWVEVIYDQTRKKTGWVRVRETPSETTASAPEGKRLAPLDTGEPVHFGIYQTWLEFMKLNAKASGIYWLSGVKEYNRSIRTSDADEAKILPVTIIRDLKVKHVRGNWLLVEVLDFERNTPIGWVRWRDDDGNLMVFPNISGQHMPIVTTAY